MSVIRVILCAAVIAVVNQVPTRADSYQSIDGSLRGPLDTSVKTENGVGIRADDATNNPPETTSVERRAPSETGALNDKAAYNSEPAKNDPTKSGKSTAKKGNKTVVGVTAGMTDRTAKTGLGVTDRVAKTGVGMTDRVAKTGLGLTEGALKGTGKALKTIF
jgi:hypothetical protein